MATIVTVEGSQGQVDKTVTFASGTTSTAVDLGGETLCGIITPASLASTTMTVYASDTLDGTYYEVQDEASATAVQFTTSSSAELLVLSSAKKALMMGLRYIKLEAGSSETSKTITLITKVI